MTTFNEVYAGVQQTIASHSQAQDDGRAEDIAVLYCEDGELIVPGMGTFQGKDVIRQTWEGWKPQQPQRHMNANVVVTEWTEDTAKATTDVVFFMKGPDGWSVGIVARYHDEFRLVGDSWLLSRRADEYVDWEPPAGA